MKEKLKLVQFGPVTEGQSQKGPWRKGVVIFETIGEYPKQIAIDFFNAKLEEVNKLNVGEICEVSFDISSREFNGKWYTSVSAFAVDGQGQPIEPPVQPQPSAPRNVKQSSMFEVNDNDDLPF